MSARATSVDRRPFHVLGISEAEEHAYLWLLSQDGGATLQQVATVLSLPIRRAQHLLDAIEERGLARHSPERPRRYLAGPPDMAIEALILQHQDELQRARVAAQKLQNKVTSGRGRSAPKDVVELITSREAEWQAFEQMQREARSEVLFFVRPPVRLQRVDVDEDYATQYRMQAKGVRYRCLVDAEFLGLQGAIARVQRDLASGQEVRVVTALPSKLVLVDHRIALVPLHPKDPGGSVLLVRASALLDTLYALFEIFWQRAAPMLNGGSIQQATLAGAPGPDIGTDQLIALLAMGINDKTIADELGLSKRTLNRRNVELMNSLGARSRFQAGWLAAFRSAAMTESSSGRHEGLAVFPPATSDGAKVPRRK